MLKDTYVLNVLRENVCMCVYIYYIYIYVFRMEKQPSRGVINKTRPEKYHQIHRRTPTPKCDPNKAAVELEWSRTPMRVFQHKSAKPPSKRAPPNDCTRLYSKIQRFIQLYFTIILCVCVCVCVRYLTVRYLNLGPVLIIDNCPVIIDNCPEGGGKLQFLQKILILR